MGYIFLAEKSILQGSKLTFCSGASWRLKGKIWSPDYKFWLTTQLTYDLHKKIAILNVTWYARKLLTKNSEKETAGERPLIPLQCHKHLIFHYQYQNQTSSENFLQ